LLRNANGWLPGQESRKENVRQRREIETLREDLAEYQVMANERSSYSSDLDIDRMKVALHRRFLECDRLRKSEQELISLLKDARVSHSSLEEKIRSLELSAQAGIEKEKELKAQWRTEVANVKSARIEVSSTKEHLDKLEKENKKLKDRVENLDHRLRFELSKTRNASSADLKGQLAESAESIRKKEQRLQDLEKKVRARELAVMRKERAGVKEGDSAGSENVPSQRDGRKSKSPSKRESPSPAATRSASSSPKQGRGRKPGMSVEVEQPASPTVNLETSDSIKRLADDFYRQVLKNKDGELEKYAEQMHQALAMLEKKELERQAMESQSTALQQRCAAAEAACKEAQEQLFQLKHVVESGTSDMQQRAQKAEAELQAQLAEATRLEQEARTVQQVLREREEWLSLKNGELETEIETLTALLKKARTDLKSWQLQFQEKVSAAVAEERAEMASLREKDAAMAREFVQSLAQKDSEIEELRAHQEGKVQSLSAQEQDNTRLQATVEALQTELDTLKATLQHERDEQRMYNAHASLNIPVSFWQGLSEGGDSPDPSSAGQPRLTKQIVSDVLQHLDGKISAAMANSAELDRRESQNNAWESSLRVRENALLKHSEALTVYRDFFIQVVQILNLDVNLKREKQENSPSAASANGMTSEKDQDAMPRPGEELEGGIDDLWVHVRKALDQVARMGTMRVQDSFNPAKTSHGAIPMERLEALKKEILRSPFRANNFAPNPRLEKSLSKSTTPISVEERKAWHC
jgi:hypothetical protein